MRKLRGNEEQTREREDEEMEREGEKCRFTPSPCLLFLAIESPFSLSKKMLFSVLLFAGKTQFTAFVTSMEKILIKTASEKAPQLVPTKPEKNVYRLP